ncbi:hypothetical protein DW322_14985 [Rhodococcus rhodnii]|nr:hypothetical protein [Rhodococcus rhodnii]TXG91276.1 hypothetical protein DW322_14985 [Rhodococcus rhodnii]
MSTAIPRPGEHLPGAAAVDPAEVEERIDGLLTRLDGIAEHAATNRSESHDPAAVVEVLGAQARLFEEAHDVLTDALASVDKV